MSTIDSKYIYQVDIDPNPIYPPIAQANIAKIMTYLKNSKVTQILNFALETPN